jgi:hypothetical protein
MVQRSDNITAIPDIKKPGVSVYLSEAEASLLVDSYLSKFGSKDDRTSTSGYELNEFFVLVKDAIRTRQRSEGVPEDKTLLFVEEDPPEKIDTEAITFYLRSRLPGKADQGPQGPGGVREVRSHIRATREHPQHPSEKLVTMGRFYDNWIVFNVYAKTNKQARERLMWFEKVMDGFNWYFKAHGYLVIEDSVSSKERVKINDNTTVTKYPITYMVRTDDNYFISTQELKEIVINVEVTN